MPVSEVAKEHKEKRRAQQMHDLSIIAAGIAGAYKEPERCAPTIAKAAVLVYSCLLKEAGEGL